MSNTAAGRKGKPKRDASGMRGIDSASQSNDRNSGNYLDFEVEIRAGQGQEYPLTVLYSPAGEARETMHFPFDEVVLESRLKSLEIALLRSGGSRRQVLSREEQAVQDFGRQLFSALFVGETRTRYDMSAGIARQRGLGLRLKLRIQAPELAKLPWEFLYDPRQGEYVCMSRETPIVRYIDLPQPIQPLTVQPPLQILGMISSPSNLAPLDVERERKRLETAISHLQSNGLVKLTWLGGSTWRDLQRAMRNGPWHIFHFIGHGGFDANADEGVIAIEDENQAAHLLLATEMGRLLADHRSLRLAILNACEGARGSEHDIFSSTAAVLVRRGMPAVLAMQYAITDRAAIEFSRAFYEALADGLPVDACVCEARKAISLAVTNTIEWGTPVLYMRTPQGMIFEVPTGQATKPVQHPFVTAEADKELQAKLDRLYTEGLAAFWVEDWDKACARFQSILDAHPDYPEAAARLEECMRQQRLAFLYTQALDYQNASNWNQAASSLEELTKESPNYKDAQALLKIVREQKQLADLYLQAHKLFEARQWLAVIKVCEQILILDPNYPDTDQLLPTAQKEVAALERKAELEDWYSQAVRAMDASQWAKARDLFKQIQSNEQAYLETEKLLARAEEEIIRTQEQKQRETQVNALYEQMHGLMRAHQWRKALARLEEIHGLDEHFSDVDGLAEKARLELDREEQETQRQTELSVMYTEAVQLLKEEKYEEALEKWSEVHARDAKFPDRQKVQSIAKRRLAERARVMPTRLPISKRPQAIAGIVIVLVALAMTGMLTFGHNIFSRPSSYATQAGIIMPATRPTSTDVSIPSSANMAPTLFDDFDTAAYNNGYNRSLWNVWGPAPQYDIHQAEGKLSITVFGKAQAGLGSINKDTRINQPTFFETRLFLDPATTDNGSHLFLAIETKSGSTTCGIFSTGANQQEITCWSEYYGTKVEKDLNLHNLMAGWHVIRFEIQPETMNIYYIIDGRPVGAFIPQDSIPDPDQLADFIRSTFHVYISLNNFGSSSAPTGYVDYVRMGAVR